MNPHYKFFDHTSDLGIELVGKDLSSLFQNAAISLTDLIINNFTPNPVLTRIIEVKSENIELLLREWLAELLYVFQTEFFLSTEIKIVDFHDERLKAELSGGVVDFDKFSVQREIKSVTYHQLSIKNTNNRYIARFVLDV